MFYGLRKDLNEYIDSFVNIDNLEGIELFKAKQKHTYSVCQQLVEKDDELSNYHKVFKNGYLYIGYDITHELLNENGFDLTLIYIDNDYISSKLNIPDNIKKLFNVMIK